MRQYTPEEYRAAKPFLDRLNTHRDRLTTDEYLGMKAMALRGNLSGAMEWLRMALGTEKKVTG